MPCFVPCLGGVGFQKKATEKGGKKREGEREREREREGKRGREREKEERKVERERETSKKEGWHKDTKEGIFLSRKKAKQHRKKGHQQCFCEELPLGKGRKKVHNCVPKGGCRSRAMREICEHTGWA